MNRLNAEYPNNTRTREYIASAIIIVYGICMLAIAIREEWDILSILIMNVGFVVSLILMLTKSVDYRQKSFTVILMLAMNVLIYAFHNEEVTTSVYLLIATVFLVCLFEVPQWIWIVVGTTTALFIRYFILYGAWGKGYGYEMEILLQFIIAYVCQMIIYSILENHAEKDRMLFDVIEELKEAEQTKSDFLTNVSHELHTPINTIYGLSEVLLREEMSDVVREKVFDMQNAGKNLLAVVSDILDFSELQSGKMKLNEVPYNIADLLNEIVGRMSPRMEEKKMELILDYDANLPRELLGDEEKIKRVLINLVDNAIKFTEEGGIAVIATQRKTEYGINLIIRVTDTGIGMKEENLEKIFTAFSQIDAKRNRLKEGVGLGMAISKAMVEVMGGFITIQSEPGKGTEVQFVIPQKVKDVTPVASIAEPEKLNVALWINLEWIPSVKVRDLYRENLKHLIEQLGVTCYICQNMAQLKMRTFRETFTHIFIGTREYQSEKDFFDELAERTKLSVILDAWNVKAIDSPKLTKIVKPLSVNVVAAELNNEKKDEEIKGYQTQIVAPQAKILVVDDNIINLKVTQNILEIYQIESTLVKSGFEALKKIESEEYDLVFMDHMMPEMDGIETLHRIRKKNKSYFKRVPIIALTANALSGMKEMFLEEGFQGYVAKPIELSVLERVLKEHLPEDKIKEIEKKAEPEQKKEPDIEIVQKENTSGEIRTLEDLDVKKGIAYCGSMEFWISTLTLQYESGEKDRESLEALFQKEDWKDYVIGVHGLKGAMSYVGNDKLSKLAADLERAGKNNDIEYIKNHHYAMMQEYEDFLDMLGRDERIKVQKEEEEQDAEYPEILEEQLKELLLGIEDSAYDLDGAKMQALLDELKQYSYKGHVMKKHFDQIDKKIEMMDYMSAYEVLEKSVKEWGMS